MGKHYLLNLYGCEFDYLNNETYLRELLEIAAEASGATVIQTISKKFEPHGVTAVCLLSESHISIHSWPEKGEAAVDIFTCGDAEPKVGCDIIIYQLKSENHNLSYIERWAITKYPHDTLIMTYKPYSPEWHRKRYLKEAIDTYFDDYVDNEIIYSDIMDILSARMSAAVNEVNKVLDLKDKLKTN